VKKETLNFCGLLLDRSYVTGYKVLVSPVCFCLIHTMNASERLNSLCLESEELNGLLRQSNFFEVVDEGEQKDWELRENALSSNRAEQEQIKGTAHE
jgi:hypothetical protein